MKIITKGRVIGALVLLGVGGLLDKATNFL